MKINLTLPKNWNACTTKQLELIADVMREQVERQNRYRPFSMQNVKIAIFFALSGIEIVEGPNPRVPVEEQYYTCRFTKKSKRELTLPFVGGKGGASFSLYLWQINYWLSPKAKTNDKESAEYVSQGAGVLDWLDNENEQFLTRFPYGTIKRRRKFSFLIPLSYKSFSGPQKDLDGFCWSQYRLASEAMQNYVQLSNNLVKMQKIGKFSQEQLDKQAKSVDMARAMFLATIFNAKVKHVETSTGMIRKDYFYESNQITDNSEYFRRFPDTQWQVILFWWTGVMHSMAKRYPHVFKVQKANKVDAKSSALDIYTATIATMQKYVGINEKDCNNQSYSLVLEQLERMSKENEELEKIRKKK